jgi:hypothetical protein
MSDDIGLGPEDDTYGAGDDDRPIDALRDMPVGTNDPNIVGDAGPLDVPPGSDPHGEGDLVIGQTEP